MDRLKNHLIEKHEHNQAEIAKKKKHFKCPFNCGNPEFRTALDVVSHSEKVHGNNLGNSVKSDKHNYMYIHTSSLRTIGLTTNKFSNFDEFLIWKEKVEESTYSAYVKGDRTYCPKSEGKRSHISYNSYHCMYTV